MKKAVLLNVILWIGAMVLCSAVALGVPGLGLGLFGVFVIVWSVSMMAVNGYLG